jgi:hypothetical protein
MSPTPWRSCASGATSRNAERAPRERPCNAASFHATPSCAVSGIFRRLALSSGARTALHFRRLASGLGSLAAADLGRDHPFLHGRDPLGRSHGAQRRELRCARTKRAALAACVAGCCLGRGTGVAGPRLGIRRTADLRRKRGPRGPAIFLVSWAAATAYRNRRRLLGRWRLCLIVTNRLRLPRGRGVPTANPIRAPSDHTDGTLPALDIGAAWVAGGVPLIGSRSRQAPPGSGGFSLSTPRLARKKASPINRGSKSWRSMFAWQAKRLYRSPESL